MDRSKGRRTDRAVWWWAGATAVGLHAAIFLFTPPFEIPPLDRGASPRMIITTGRWAMPLCGPACPGGVVAYDTLDPAPLLTNGPELDYLLPQVYPNTLWRYLEPAAGTIHVTVSERGNVEEAFLVESTDNGADEALLTIARRMKFDLPDPGKYARGLAGRFHIEVRPPR